MSTVQVTVRSSEERAAALRHEFGLLKWGGPLAIQGSPVSVDRVYIKLDWQAPVTPEEALELADFITRFIGKVQTREKQS